jgi:hypothetical protein
MLGTKKPKRALTGHLDNSLAMVDTDSARSLQIITSPDFDASNHRDHICRRSLESSHSNFSAGFFGSASGALTGVVGGVGWA